MPLNPNIIKHPFDDEEYANACPTIGTLVLAHFSTTEQHSDILYQIDGLFWAMNPSRRMYLREALPNEFDIWTTFEEFEQRPKLWVLVSLLAEGFHERTPRWRGRQFWKAIESDKDVAEVIHEMSLRGGVHLSEWLGFVQDQRIRKNVKANNRKRVN